MGKKTAVSGLGGAGREAAAGRVRCAKPDTLPRSAVAGASPRPFSASRSTTAAIWSGCRRRPSPGAEVSAAETSATSQGTIAINVCLDIAVGSLCWMVMDRPSLPTQTRPPPFHPTLLPPQPTALRPCSHQTKQTTFGRDQDRAGSRTRATCSTSESSPATDVLLLPPSARIQALRS